MVVLTDYCMGCEEGSRVGSRYGGNRRGVGGKWVTGGQY